MDDLEREDLLFLALILVVLGGWFLCRLPT